MIDDADAEVPAHPRAHEGMSNSADRGRCPRILRDLVWAFTAATNFFHLHAATFRWLDLALKAARLILRTLGDLS